MFIFSVGMRSGLLHLPNEYNRGALRLVGQHCVEGDRRVARVRVGHQGLGRVYVAACLRGATTAGGVSRVPLLPRDCMDDLYL